MYHQFSIYFINSELKITKPILEDHDFEKQNSYTLNTIHFYQKISFVEQKGLAL